MFSFQRPGPARTHRLSDRPIGIRHQGPLFTALLIGLQTSWFAAPSLAAGYDSSPERQLHEGLDLEQDPLRQTAPLSVESGWIQLQVTPRERRLRGLLIMVGARAEQGVVQAALPPGVRIEKTSVQCREAYSRVEDGRLAIEVGECPPQGCAIEVTWSMDASAWGPENPSRLDESGYWLRATDVMPRLVAEPILRQGSDSNRLDALSNSSRLTPNATALADNWRWIVRIDGIETERLVRRGRVAAPLDFADTWTSGFEPSTPKDLATQGEPMSAALASILKSKTALLTSQGLL
ncbi:hypothetical protein ThidrDRAFT_4378 [Thiorhodococcus drewsii AZ1]|uniref:Uncharacterized protein n=1 Tax=Thiorhodococcus drewsii AZ1 TaxID=765913 RepID=G2E7W4_9GAMM|nr:hypothetical protein [Thiorhodococcus drewsii]EGV27804.1 hypothetical protein ThidrDRAFT_4378 [Thiorhodococcus drewsii AZ1]